jgi:fatty acid desaturase
MTTTPEIGGTSDRHGTQDRPGDLGERRDHEALDWWRDELDRERRTKHVRRIAFHCGLIFAIYLAAGVVFSSMGWNAWVLLGGTWSIVVAFAIMSD